MGKYVMERLFKVFNIAGMAFIFVGGHTGYISGKDMLYQLLLFVIVYCFMTRTYEAFETQTKKSMELIYSQGLALFLADAVTYLTGYVTKTSINDIWMMLLKLVAQTAFAAIYTLGSNQIMCHLYGKKEAAVLYGNSEMFEKMKDLRHMSDWIHVKMWIRVLEVTPQTLEQLKDVDLVILQEIDRVQKDQILRYCAANGIEVYLKPEMEDVLMCSMKSVSVNGTMLLQIGNKNERPVYELVKRMMDICISVVGLVLASPVMLITAGLIKAQDRGTVLYSQKRLTKDGKIFEIYKFRSMKMDAEKDGKARLAEKSDDRITTVGKWIRMTRIDELPQFINVLRGDMSIVGPRPERPELAEKYTEENPEFTMRLKVKAGITGFAQVYGRYNTPAIEKAQMDAYYIRKASVLMDLRLILATVKVLFMKESSEGVVTESKTENRAENKAYKMIKERDCMRFSVVVPLYNKENCIRMTLESVKKQSFKDYEVIVVDDGSTDRSLEEARKIKSENITIIHQQNQGVSVARDTGILHAQGQYIAFLDADDEWEPDYLKTIDHLIEKYPESDMYVTAYRVDMGNGKSHYSARLTPATGCLESYWLTYQYAYDFVWTSATVIRTSAVLKAGLFRPGEKIGQDLDLWSRVARNNPKVAYSSEVCVNYHRMAEANARTRVKVAKADAFIKNLEEELEDSAHSKEELAMIQRKYNMKMTVYIYTSILAGNKAEAREAMKRWKGQLSRKAKMVQAGLKIARIMPDFVLRMVYAARLKVF